jgi:acetyltransferase-like isoleucine patch superfamily enzyme
MFRRLFFDWNLPKSVYFNFKYFPFSTAIKLPVLVTKQCLLTKCEGTIQLPEKIHRGIIRIGHGNIPIFDRKKSRTIWDVSGTVIFKGSCVFGHGSKISVTGTLIIGDDFEISAESRVVATKRVEFGNSVLLSWDCQIMDCDFHDLKIDGQWHERQGAIIIGNHNLLYSGVRVFKNTVLGDNNVVAASSLLNKNYNCSNSLLAGVPAKIVKENIDWKK